jgi:hypothetical protein
MEVDIKDLDKVKVLQALYNAKAPMGMGMLHYNPEPMSDDQARKAIAAFTYLDKEYPDEPDQVTCYFDYVAGRPLKVDIAGDTADMRLYDRDGGEGMGDFVIHILRIFDDPNHPIIQELHRNGMVSAIGYARFLVGEDSPKADEVVKYADGSEMVVKSLDGHLLGNEALGAAIKRAEESLRR